MLVVYTIPSCCVLCGGFPHRMFDRSRNRRCGVNFRGMMQGQAAVSVVIPARNAADTLRRALESVGGQVVQPLEVIVIDDASTDETRTLANSFPAVTVLSLEQP